MTVKELNIQADVCESTVNKFSAEYTEFMDSCVSENDLLKNDLEFLYNSNNCTEDNLELVNKLQQCNQVVNETRVEHNNCFSNLFTISKNCKSWSTE